MAKKAAQTPKHRQKPTASRTRTKSTGKDYHVVLREAGGTSITATVADKVLYPIAVAWNQVLASTKDPKQSEQVRRDWRTNARDTVKELAELACMDITKTGDFIKAAAKSGVVQVEMNWEREDLGYAARVFPWEALIALATKDERERLGQTKIAIVRRLTGGATDATPADGAPLFLVTEDVKTRAMFDYDSELAAVGAALGKPPLFKTAGSLEAIARAVSNHPRIVHFVLQSVEKGVLLDHVEGEELDLKSNDEVAAALAKHGPELAVFSSCYTGRRLAPQAIVAGARLAIGFQDEVTDAILPVFFGAFYRSWNAGVGALAALNAALDTVKNQGRADDLGTVTLWSSSDLIEEAARTKTADKKTAASIKGTGDGGALTKEKLIAMLPVICDPEPALNYSVLHNSRDGLFKAFVVTKISSGPLDDLEVHVSIDTGTDRPAECSFFVKMPDTPDSQANLAERTVLPLGAQLLRQRGEIVLGTVSISIKCGGIQFFHKLARVKILPCDEWNDQDTSGRHFLPSFVFPRDPAVRTILSTAQPFLRALTDRPPAGFDGYQSTFADSSAESARLQTRALWAALQHPLRLDYVNPPPTYTKQAQRLRTPEEILRARRGTCIELALLLAACWEHIGIQPVIFLTKGHAFTGYWAGEREREEFMGGLGTMLDHAKKLTTSQQPSKQDQLGGVKQGATDVSEVWMLAEPFHLSAIRSEVLAGRLVPVEATFIPLQNPFDDAINSAKQMLLALKPAEFDGMLDVQTARDRGITPLAIVTEGTAA